MVERNFTNTHRILTSICTAKTMTWMQEKIRYLTMHTVQVQSSTQPSGGKIPGSPVVEPLETNGCSLNAYFFSFFRKNRLHVCEASATDHGKAFHVSPQANRFR